MIGARERSYRPVEGAGEGAGGGGELMRVPFVGPHDRADLDRTAAWHRRRNRGSVFASLLAPLEDSPVTPQHAEERGASYSTLNLIAARAGLDEAESEGWTLLAESVPLSEGQALRILAALSGRAA